MAVFLIITLISYISIDFAVYWVGQNESATIAQITVHHLKMLPVYLLANVLLTTGFIYGLKSGKLPMHLFGTSMLIWSISLLVVGIVLYSQMPGWKTFAGFGLLLIGVYIIQMDIGK